MTTGSIFAQFEKQYVHGPLITADLGDSLRRFSIGALFGPSGCGKTTILRCLAGLERPERGKILFGEDVWFDGAQGKFLPPQKRGVGFLFQDYALFPHLSVEHNISYGLRHLARPERRKRVGDMLDFFRLHGLEKRHPRSISGGQAQRVALARALALRPRLLLLDEPLSALDTPTREELRPELQKYLAEFRTPALIVTHDRLEAFTLADHMTVLEKGHVLQSGPTQDLFRHPISLPVARILGVETVEPGKIVVLEEGLATIQVGSIQLMATTSIRALGNVHVCIRAEDVMLQKGGPVAALSIRNQIPARVHSFVPEGPLVRVLLDCGFPLMSLVTRHALEDMNLALGDPVTALIKATSIHLLGQTN